MYDPDLIPCNVPDGDHLHELEIRRYLARGNSARKGKIFLHMNGKEPQEVGTFEHHPDPIARKRTPREFGDFILALEIGEAMGGRVLG